MKERDAAMSTDKQETGRNKLPIEILVAAPRGFCAGVERAIKIVEQTLEQWGPPVYVRHEIVHNRQVVNALHEKGAIFVDELHECPDDRPVIFSAHGVPRSVIEEAKSRNLHFIDAVCPLVSKVHNEAKHHVAANRQVVMIGHKNHPETIGTLGHVNAQDALLVETVEDVQTLEPRDPNHLAFITQTTLGHDDTADIIAALRVRFPKIKGPKKDDICYAATNRQQAVKAIAPRIDALIVAGAPHSSNSSRLVEVGLQAGCKSAQLTQGADEIDWAPLANASAIGVTAGASAPESLVNEIIAALADRFSATISTVTTTEENIVFNLPRSIDRTSPPGQASA